jgi:hypothetical protein
MSGFAAAASSSRPTQNCVVIPATPKPPSSRPTQNHRHPDRPKTTVIPTGGGALCRRSGGTPAFRLCLSEGHGFTGCGKTPAFAFRREQGALAPGLLPGVAIKPFSAACSPVPSASESEGHAFTRATIRSSYVCHSGEASLKSSPPEGRHSGEARISVFALFRLRARVYARYFFCSSWRLPIRDHMDRPPRNPRAEGPTYKPSRLPRPHLIHRSPSLSYPLPLTPNPCFSCQDPRSPKFPITYTNQTTYIFPEVGIVVSLQRV